MQVWEFGSRIVIELDDPDVEIEVYRLGGELRALLIDSQTGAVVDSTDPAPRLRVIEGGRGSVN